MNYDLSNLLITYRGKEFVALGTLETESTDKIRSIDEIRQWM